MENNDNNYIINPIAFTNKNLSPIKEYQFCQSNGFINKDNLQNIPFINNSLFCYATPKKDFHQLEQEAIFSPIASNSKLEIINNNLLSTIRKNSLNEISPFRPYKTPYNNSKSIEKM